MSLLRVHVRRLSQRWADSGVVASRVNAALMAGGEALIAEARTEAHEFTRESLRDGMDGPPGSWSQSFDEDLTFNGSASIEGVFRNVAEHALFVEEDTDAHVNGPPPFDRIADYLSRHGDLSGDPHADYWLIEGVRKKIDEQGTRGKYIMESTRQIVFPRAYDIFGEKFRKIVF